MNTILITVDALRADHLEEYGYDRNTMPGLSHVTTSGMTFKNAFANGPYTRVSVPAIHSSVRLAHANLSSLPTISGELSRAGMTTACIGTRTGFKSAEGSLHFDTYVTHGRDEYHKKSRQQQPKHVKIEKQLTSAVSRATQISPKLHQVAEQIYNSLPISESSFEFKGYTSAKVVTDSAVDWLTEHSGDDFFLWLHYMEGHRPYGVHNNDPEYTSEVSNDRIRKLMKKAGTNPVDMTSEEHELVVDLYDSDLKYCSSQLDRLFSHLKDLSLWRNTNIIFTSDHGEEFHDHSMYFHRNLPYDELLHVPLIVYQPNNEREEEILEQRELVDVAPTILDFHNVKSPDSFEGVNLLSGESRKVIATGSQQNVDPVVAGRWDGYKYIYTPNKEYLYDLSASSREVKDISDEREDMSDRFRQEIPKKYFDEEIKEELREPEDEVDRERLKALGYLEVDE